MYTPVYTFVNAGVDGIRNAVILHFMDEREKHLLAIRRRCREIRASLGLSYRAAEGRTGVPFNTISRIENGKVEPSSEVLFRLAKGYGVTLKSLLCGE